MKGTQRVPQLTTSHDVESGRGLVEKDDLRIADQRERDGEPALLPAAQAAHLSCGNLAKTELRRRKRWHWVAIGPAPEEEERVSCYEPVDAGPLPGEYTDARTVHSSVARAIEELPAEFREAVELRDLDGLSYEEIARIIDCPVGTVKSRVNRGRLRLQKRLRSLADEFLGELMPAAAIGT